MVGANLIRTAAPVSEIAEMPGIREVLRWFTREKQWVNEIHLQLCRIPSLTFLERERAEWFAAQLKTIGWYSRIDAAGNVLASLGSEFKVTAEALPGLSAVSGSEGPLVALTAHLDTVLAPRTREDISIDRDGDLLGPGVSDNGAGLAALLAVAKAIKAGTNGFEHWNRLLLVANVGEEGEGNLCGMRHICANPDVLRRISAFLVLDGAAIDHITVQALGSRRFEVAFSGMGGHSWSDFGIGNPVHALSRAVSSFVDQNPLDPRSTPKVALNVGIIEGGSSINSIPSMARAKVDIRSESNEKIESLVAALQNAVHLAQEVENARALHGKDPSHRVTAKVKEIGNRPAARLPADAPIMAVVRSVDAHLGIRSRLDCASTDANIPLSMGIPAISIGAGGKGGGAHTASEWYRPDGRDLGLKRILLAAAMLLRDSSPE